MRTSTLLHHRLGRLAGLAGLFWALAATASADVLYLEDFENYTPTVASGEQFPVITNKDGSASWNGHNWTADSFMEYGIVADAAHGSQVLSRSIESYAWWYGGGFFGPKVPVHMTGTSLSEYHLKLSMVATSVDTVGSAGVSILCFAEDGTTLGARYKGIPLLKTWYTHDLALSDMTAEVPDEVGKPPSTPGDFTLAAAQIQVIVWLRGAVEGEKGWPIGLDGKIWSISLDDISFSGPGGGVTPEPESPWKGYTSYDGALNTGEKTEPGWGWLYDAAYPFAYSFALAEFRSGQPAAGWLYIHPEGASLESFFAYDFAASVWLWHGAGFGPWFVAFKDTGVEYVNIMP